VRETVEYLIKIEAINVFDEQKKYDELDDYQVVEFSRFLFEGVGLNKNTIGDFLGENKPFASRVNFAFFSLFSF
jgi:Sec7-like guanine-nucleotide exchange factor